MARLEDLTRGAALKGILPECSATVVDVKRYGAAAVELTYKDVRTMAAVKDRLPIAQNWSPAA